MKKYDVVVVGGGAAGLMAGGYAAQNGADTVILEKMQRPARKLRITGKGRCNVTNSAEVVEFIKHFGKNGRFLRQAFARFFSQNLIDLLEHAGVPLVVERGGRVFPQSGKATDVVDALVKWTRKSGAEIETEKVVKELLFDGKKVCGVKLEDGEIYHAESVIITTGGKSYPLTGSTGDGYIFAETAGHSIVPTRPALVALETFVDTSRLADFSLRNVNVKLLVDSKKKRELFGELAFTDSGISGPTILSLSRDVVDALNDKKLVSICIDLKPALDEKKLDARLLRELDSNGKKDFRTLLNSLLPMKMIPYCIEQLKIPEDKICHQISGKERRELLNWFKELKFGIKKSRPFSEAIVTAGGVSTKEINPKTMESRLIENLYFAGEVLDLDADTGGYNLQAAFSTGYLAGISAASDRC